MFLALLACARIRPTYRWYAATQGQDIAVAYLEKQSGTQPSPGERRTRRVRWYMRGNSYPSRSSTQLASLHAQRRDPSMQPWRNQQGVVTRPLDDISNYEESLASLDIGQPICRKSQPANAEFLGEAGYDEEQSILPGILR